MWLRFPTSADYQNKIHDVSRENPNYEYYIHVDAECMRSVLDGLKSLLKLRDKGETQDEGEPELEGRTSRDVGCMKVAVQGLELRVYETIGKRLHVGCFQRQAERGDLDGLSPIRMSPSHRHWAL
jgi:hypothetical protein